MGGLTGLSDGPEPIVICPHPSDGGCIIAEITNVGAGGVPENPHQKATTTGYWIMSQNDEWTPARFVHLPTGKTAYLRRTLTRHDWVEWQSPTDPAANKFDDYEVAYNDPDGDYVEYSDDDYFILENEDDEIPDEQVDFDECGWVDEHGNPCPNEDGSDEDEDEGDE